MAPRSDKRILIIGCGYVGRMLALKLAHDGWGITACVRTEASAAALSAEGLDAIAADASDPRSWDRLPRDCDAAIFCAATRGGGPADYRAVYLEGMHRLAASVGRHTHLVFTSSTSVYGQDDGSWVDETSPTQPEAETARILLEAEAVCLKAGGAVARLAGIYGPGRSGPLRLLRSGQAAAGPSGGRWMNQIHRDDAAGALRFLAQRRATGVFNVCDDFPSRQGEFYSWLAARTGLPAPGEGIESFSRRGATNKRVSNEKLRSLGWSPEFSSFVEGYQTILDPS